jgi:teichuronic acid biosynthesis glycosyltransferase TuaG
VILKKNLFSKNIKFPNIKTKEDFILWLQILKKKIPIIALDKNLSFWRKLNNSLSSSTIQKIFDGFRVYHVYMNYSIFKSILNLFYLSINFLKKIIDNICLIF